MVASFVLELEEPARLEAEASAKAEAQAGLQKADPLDPDFHKFFRNLTRSGWSYVPPPVPPSPGKTLHSKAATSTIRIGGLAKLPRAIDEHGWEARQRSLKSERDEKLVESDVSTGHDQEEYVLTAWLPAS